MKLIGYWIRNLNDTELPLPQELVGELPAGVRKAVCEYLGRGELYAVYRGYSWCRFHCGIDDEGLKLVEYTDGEWIWPGDLVHYVNVHGILLPDEFIACATSTRSPQPDDDRSASLEFWISWAKTRQSPSIRRLLNEKLAAARGAKPALIDALVAEIRQKETESSDNCIFAGCSERALTGCRICARHSLSEARINSETAHLFRLPREI
jgi:hypothetical protein